MVMSMVRCMLDIALRLIVCKGIQGQAACQIPTDLDVKGGWEVGADAAAHAHRANCKAENEEINPKRWSDRTGDHRHSVRKQASVDIHPSCYIHTYIQGRAAYFQQGGDSLGMLAATPRLSGVLFLPGPSVRLKTTT